MVVGLKVDFFWYSIGEPDFLHSFFSTICVNLESGDWGSKFPVLMNELYQGNLEFSKIDLALEELSKIEKQFKKLNVEKAVWDINDLKKSAPWENNISSDINNLSEYFWTSSGENIFVILEKALTEARNEHVNIEIVNL